MIYSKGLFYSCFIIVTFTISAPLFAQNQRGTFNNQSGNYDPGMRPEFKEERPSAEQMAKMQTSQMKKDLNLNAEEEKRIAAINLKYAREFEDQLKSSPEMTEYDKAMLAKIRNDQKEELRNALTEDQWNLYLKKEKARHEQRQKNR